jgi:hypothetical protein
MLEQYLIQIIEAIILGLWGFLWIEILVTPSGIFSFLPRWYFRLFDRENPKHFVIASALAKPLFECATCHAGWIALITNCILAEFFSYYGFMSVTVSMVTAFFVSQWANR